ncbi:MAG TPA: protein kinase [Blastocatellia bacterium]|nr:protein kinase [Blastocatellia bacterium]
MEPGDRLGPYEIVSPLGSGGMGKVYRARDTRLSRDVAIKVLPDAHSSDEKSLSRLRREARAASALNHPNIVTIYEIDRVKAITYIAMEFVDGKTLQEMLAAERLPISEMLGLAAQVADGLAKAHAAGIVHRDLKPANLMISKDGYIKILDFGLAKFVKDRDPLDSDAQTESLVTQPGFIMGTVAYMSPEQASGRVVDFRSDQFSFGAILYEMATGQRAFQRATPVQTLSAVIEQTPGPIAFVNPQVSPAFQQIVRRCLAKEPADRYGSTQELANELKHERDSISKTAESIPLQASFKDSSAAAPQASRARENSGAKEVEEKRRIAILPFKNLQSDPELDFLGFALAQEITISLATKDVATVRPTSYVAKYRTLEIDPRQVGRDLHVDTIVDGFYRRAGNRLKISVQMFDIDSGSLLGQQSITTDPNDISDVEERLVKKITKSLALSLTPKERARIRRARTVDSKAYEFYLKGRYHFNTNTREELDIAIEMFQRSTEIDPHYAEAYAALAHMYTFKCFSYDSNPLWEERARELCQKAIEINPNVAEAEYVFARLAWSPSQRFNHRQAIKHNRRVLELDPTFAPAYSAIGLVFNHIGLFDEALRLHRKALELDPKNSFAETYLGIDYLWAGQYDEAIKQFDQVLRDSPRHFSANSVVPLAHLYRGSMGDSEEAVQRSLHLFPADTWIISNKALLEALKGNAEEAELLLKKCQSIGSSLGHFHHAEYNFALVYAQLGDKDRAVESLRRAIDNGWPCYPFIRDDPYLDPLRESSEFRTVLNDLRNLWESYKNEFLPFDVRTSS